MERDELRALVGEAQNAALNSINEADAALDSVTDRIWAELERYRNSVTTGGPAPFTQRPDEVVELSVSVPVAAEQAQTMAYGPCEDCGVRHPTWISCEAEAQTHPRP